MTSNIGLTAKNMDDNTSKPKKIRKTRSNSVESSRSINTIPSDVELELLKSDDDSPRSTKQQSDSIMKVLKDIQKNQFTKKDSKDLKKSIDDKFTAVESELHAHKSRFVNIESRLTQFESKITLATYDKELQKQQQLKNNISIFGYPKLVDENVKKTASSIFMAFGCNLTEADFAAVYRTESKSSKFSSIIVKFIDFEKKLLALNAKAKKPIKVSDVMGATGNQFNAQIYLNNHVTPFFSRLLAAGRQATKDGVIHSCFIGTNGCLIKMKEGGKSINIRSLNDFDEIRTKSEVNATNKRSQPDEPTSPQDSNAKKIK